MSQINLLSQSTIDKIAAGEVIERPSSIVKELVENAIDAGANAITVEIRDGGISLIRVTDNGEGIAADQVPRAFLRHATSKIREVTDLEQIDSLGFRGEALSSIAAISQVELITKQTTPLTGVRYRIDGGEEISLEEIGAPEGSTFLIRNLFYNTPARKKFLKSAASEAGHISDLIEHLALSHPEISFQFITNGQTRLHTSGNHNLKDIIYNVYGREIAANLLPVEAEQDGLRLRGFLGKPSISRGNRGYENYYVNGRYVQDGVLSRAIEEGYGNHMMQHRYPFTVLFLTLPGSQVDVNVHPAKREVRFSDRAAVYALVEQAVRETLSGREMIPEASVLSEKEQKAQQALEERERKGEGKGMPEPFEQIRRGFFARHDSPYEPKYPYRGERVRETASSAGWHGAAGKPSDADLRAGEAPPHAQGKPNPGIGTHQDKADAPTGAAAAVKTDARQLNLFEEKFLSREHVPEHRIIGQVFDTYWLVEYREHLYIIDQHAAHEKVMYEWLCRRMEKKEATSQQISPPLVLSLTMQEEELLRRYLSDFTQIGFEIEHFGGRDYAIRAVPDNLYGFTEQRLFTQMLDSLSEDSGKPSEKFLYEKLASMACKAAVKGNNRLSFQEAGALIGELLTLENPYQCPHGRPTIISMSKYEMEKKFKRIVSSPRREMESEDE